MVEYTEETRVEDTEETRVEERVEGRTEEPGKTHLCTATSLESNSC